MAVCVTPPPLPVIVSVKVPGDADGVVVTLRAELNGGIPDVGLTDAATPGGDPDRLRATLCVVPDTRFTVTAKLVLPPGATFCWEGEMDIEKSKGAAATIVKLVLIMLLLGFGSPTVETVQVRVCVPRVAVHGVSALIVAGVPVGPG